MSFPEEIPHFHVPFLHPDWAFAHPTTTYDVYYFYLRFPPGKNQLEFSIFYEGSVKVFFTLEKRDNQLILHLYVQGEQVPNDLSPEEIEEATWNRFSLWLCNLSQARDYSFPPPFSWKYQIWEDLKREAIVPYQSDLMLGFFNGPWESDE
ncbi:MAG: hypothetical protein AAFU64_19675 [Bacteroidota bacterium]